MTTAKYAARFSVGPGEQGRTLAAALRQWQQGASWADVRGLIGSRRVLVNGNVCLDEARRLQPGEVVHVTHNPQAPPPTTADVRLVHVDPHLVVVEKPSGMTTNRHPSERFWSEKRKRRNPTLDDVLPQLLAQRQRGTQRSGGRPPRVRPVHRLDRETSGLLVFARTPEAEVGLIKQFKEHTVARAYLAVVSGRVTAQTFESYLVEDRGDGRRGSTSLPGQGKRAVTHVRPVEFLRGYTLLECRLETGRTHQIRIHLSEAGHPVCGDPRYHQPLFQPPIEDRSGAPRLALHAAELGFVHPITAKPLHFESPLPPDLAEFVAELR